MSRPAKRTPERKLQVVLSVLRCEVSAAEAARRAGVTEQTVHNWKNALLEAGRPEPGADPQQQPVNGRHEGCGCP